MIWMIIYIICNCFSAQGAYQPIHSAARNGQTEVIEFLVDECGVDPGSLIEVDCWSMHVHTYTAMVHSCLYSHNF